MKLLPIPFLLLAVCLLQQANVRGSDLAEAEQLSLQAAIDRVAPSVVQLRMVGGLDRIGRTSLAQGPTTGLILTADGYIISSAFNFAQQPSSIVVRLPSGDQVPAELVARDKNRMLVLLKAETDQPLPVPTAVPLDEIQVGQWAVALGRTFRDDRVGVSVGILSAKNRMYGRVVQTDAKVSAANYGGPLVDIRGRVIGLLTPMSPQSGSENGDLAGAEFYDSGIGFAVPMADVLRLLPRLKLGRDLLPGKLGIGLTAGSVYVTEPEIATVWRGSPAAQAGWKPKDMVVAVDGKEVETQAQLRFALKPRYAGDRLQITIRRGIGDDTEQITKTLTLAGELEAYRHAFLGVLPAREEPPEDQQGIEVRTVWPGSPAEQAGLAAGDRILKLNDQEVTNVKEARSALARSAPGEPVEVVLSRDTNEQTLTASLSTMPGEILSRADLPLDDVDDSHGAVALKPLKVAEFAQIAKYYAPEQQDNRRRGLLLWLAEGKQEHDLELAKHWQAAYGRDDVVLVIAHSLEETGWSAEDREFLQVLLRMASMRFEIDPQRSVVLGTGKAGQLGYAMAFNRRSSLSGVISLDAPLPRTMSLPPSLPGRRLAVLTIETPDSPFVPLIRKNVEQLQEAGYATSWWQRPPSQDQESLLDEDAFDVIARWLDGLDRF